MMAEKTVFINVSAGGVSVNIWRVVVHQNDTIRWICNRRFQIIPEGPWIFLGPTPPFEGPGADQWQVESGPMVGNAANGDYGYGISVEPLQERRGAFEEPEYLAPVYIDPEYRKVP